MILFLNNLLLLLTSVLLLLDYVEKILISWHSWCPMILSKTCRNKICLNLISTLYSYMLSWWKSVRRITRQNDEHTMTNMLLKETGIQCTMANIWNQTQDLRQWSINTNDDCIICELIYVHLQYRVISDNVNCL